MDRERRAPGLAVLVVLAFAACHHDNEQTITNAASAYDRLKPKLADLEHTLAGLHPSVDALSRQVPGGADLRQKLLAGDEVLGVLNAKMQWLSGELETARQPGKQERIAALTVEITKATKEIGQMSALAVELTHEQARLQRLAALLQAPYERTLSTGYTIKAAKDGIEPHLLAAIETSDQSDLTFDRLAFTDDGRLDLQRSRSQLDNIAQILSAYPAAALKLGGCSPRDLQTALLQLGVTPAQLEISGSQSCKARRTTARLATK